MNLHAILDSDNMVENIVFLPDNFYSGAENAPTHIRCTNETGIASIGMYYIPEHNQFSEKRPYESWQYSVETRGWNPPVEYPTEPGVYYWDESSLSWKS